MIFVSSSVEKKIILCPYSASFVPPNLLHTYWIEFIPCYFPGYCRKWLPYIPCTEALVFFQLLRVYQRIHLGPEEFVVVSSLGEVLRRGVVSTSPNSHLEDHPLSVVRDCLFRIFAAILHTGSRSSICNLSTRHAVVTGTQLSWSSWCIPLKYALGWSAVVLCACEIILFFSVLFG